MKFKSAKIYIFCIALLPFLVIQTSAFAQPAKILKEGKNDYELSCQACHGKEGKGDGEMASILVMPPADLTQISKRNKGKFPFWRTYEIVAGQKDVNGHQGFQMPQFWLRYRRDEDKPAYFKAEIRILLLTHYLESIQSD